MSFSSSCDNWPLAGRNLISFREGNYRAFHLHDAVVDVSNSESCFISILSSQWKFYLPHTATAAAAIVVRNFFYGHKFFMSDDKNSIISCCYFSLVPLAANWHKSSHLRASLIFLSSYRKSREQSILIKILFS